MKNHDIIHHELSYFFVTDKKHSYGPPHPPMIALRPTHIELNDILRNLISYVLNGSKESQKYFLYVPLLFKSVTEAILTWGGEIFSSFGLVFGSPLTDTFGAVKNCDGRPIDSVLDLIHGGVEAHSSTIQLKFNLENGADRAV